MLLFFTGFALALPPPLSEEELAEQADHGFLGVVTEVDCLSSSEDGDGVLTNRFVATIDVEEVLLGDVPDQIQLVYIRYEYPPDYPVENCQTMDSHHPLGERARYYVDAEDGGMYPIYADGYFIVDESTADFPECDPLDEPEEEQDDTEELNEETDDGTEKTSSCAHINLDGYVGLWMMGLCLVASRKNWRT